mgnify:CR=1 FL=1
MARDKGRHEIALKLLEIYHARKSATGVRDGGARSCARRSATRIPLWQKAAAMGAQIDPTNPLYAAARRRPRPTPRWLAAAPRAASPTSTSTSDGSSGSAVPRPRPDFDLDLDATSQLRRPTCHRATPSTMDFDLAPRIGRSASCRHRTPSRRRKKSPRSTSTSRASISRRRSPRAPLRACALPAGGHATSPT